MSTIFELSASQEERLVDIARGVPKPRGGRNTSASLKRRGLLEWKDDHFVLSDLGRAQYELILKRRPRYAIYGMTASQRRGDDNG